MISTALLGLGVLNELNAEPPYSRYVAAVMEDYELLEQIRVFVGNEYENGIPLSTLAFTYQSPSQLIPFAVFEKAYINTTLGDNELKNLSGVMYITSSHQWNNSKYGLNIKKWNLSKSNPMHTNEGDLFFSSVNKFSLRMTAFYIKITGLLKFVIGPGKYDIDGFNTSSFTTTGFYMKLHGDDDSTTTINIRRDTSYNGSSGANVVGHLPPGGEVTVNFYDNPLKYEQSVVPNGSFTPWGIPNIAQTFEISSTNGKAGEYYVQYFVHRGTKKETTVKPTTTTVTTTTKTTTTQQQPQTTQSVVIQTTATSTIQTTTKSTVNVKLIVSTVTLNTIWLYDRHANFRNIIFYSFFPAIQFDPAAVFAESAKEDGTYKVGSSPFNDAGRSGTQRKCERKEMSSSYCLFIHYKNNYERTALQTKVYKQDS
eukprot:NP_510737.1 Uncharacterized protein CELE_C30E1.8 [Caenorhabditis elegans]